MELLTTLAHIYPVETKEGKWVWAVKSFEETPINESIGKDTDVPESADTYEELTTNRDL